MGKTDPDLVPEWWGATRGMWRPRKKNQQRPARVLRAMIRSLTNDGELIIEFAVRVLLGQDLRLATDWTPLLRGAKLSTRGGGTKRPAQATRRLAKLRRALAALPEPPVITMDDRRWAAQILLAYGWGLPSREIGDPGPDDRRPSALAIRAAEIVEEFAPRGAEEEVRLERALAVIDATREGNRQAAVSAGILTPGPDGTWVTRTDREPILP